MPSAIRAFFRLLTKSLIKLSFCERSPGITGAFNQERDLLPSAKMLPRSFMIRYIVQRYTNRDQALVYGKPVLRKAAEIKIVNLKGENILI
jgi:hypothetical protein